LAVAVSCTDWPELNHVPEGLGEMLPLPEGLTVVSRRYSVEKEAVYVWFEDGVVIVCVCDPPSLQ